MRIPVTTIALALFAGASYAADVSYFRAADVDAAFAKGAVLYAKPGTNFMVHASRREAPGHAEVHVKDADVIHVLDGTATFVTGGTAVDPREVEPDEIRGREIRGGETRTLAKGDVVIVPAGTPHWFKAVNAP